MQFQFSYYILLLVVAALVSGVLAVLVSRSLEKRTAPQILGVLVASFVWASADALRIASVDPSLKLFWQNFRFLGSTLVVLAVFLHALEYTGRERLLSRRYLVGFSAIFVVTNVLVWTSGPLGHELIYTGFEPVHLDSILLVEISYGPWFFVNAVYSYLLLLAAVAMYVIEFLQRRGTYRRQTGGLIVGTLAPWLLNGLFLAGVTPTDLTAFGFTVTATALTAQLFWFRLLDVIPIARSTVVDHIEHGYLVVDTEDRVLDANEASAELLETSRGTMIGTEIGALFTDYPEVLEKFGGERDTRDDITLVRNGERREYEVDISPVYDSHDAFLGRVILIRDVTERRRSQRKLEERTKALERQNEKLDRFASIVSHDLRNPIAIARGHLEIARTDGDPESFDRVEEALERMETITDDVLELARQQEALIDPEIVELAEICRQAWSTAETDEATLVIDTARVLEADPGRLQQALENLFRNAAEHGSPGAGSETGFESDSTVTVRVGGLSGGFYVEDDGAGIPKSKRENVLKSGFTTEEGGTGLGLAIVSSAADAHGWELTVTESDSGGARFEFTGVGAVGDDTELDTTTN